MIRIGILAGGGRLPLMIAESDPAGKETMVKLIVNLINNRN